MSATPNWPGSRPNSSPVSIILSQGSNASPLLRDWVESLPREEKIRALRAGIRAAPRLAEDQFWSRDGDWRTWVLLGGRGSGKTFAGGFWLNELAREKGLTFALVGPALHDVREVMVEGPSGLKAQAASDNRPRWEAGRRRLIWPSGSAAYAFSAEDPDSLRGPQFHAAWADEFCAWRHAETTLSNLRFGLRLGDDPKLAITTTPRPIAALRRLLAEPGVVKARLATAARRVWIAR